MPTLALKTLASPSVSGLPVSILPLQSPTIQYSCVHNVYTAKLLQQSRTGGPGGPPMARTATGSTTSSAISRAPPPLRSPSAGSSTFSKKPPPPPGSATGGSPPPYTPPTSEAVAPITKKPPPPPPPIKPKPKPAVSYVVALYDFAAQADGDLSFRAGDKIEVVERTDSAEDWWTGRVDGREGVFPGELACVE